MSALGDAALAAACLAVDPLKLGGVCLHSAATQQRDQWLALLRALLPESTPIRRIPCSIPDDRLFGGLDLAATLRAGRPVSERGALAHASGGALVISMAERMTPRTAACIAAQLDQSEFAVVALDEGVGDERIAVALLDRVAFICDLTVLNPRDSVETIWDRDDILAARALVSRVSLDSDITESLCATSAALGAGSLRVCILATRVARVLAALDGRDSVMEDDAMVAARLVLSPRAVQRPQSPRDSEALPASAAEGPTSQATGEGWADAVPPVDTHELRDQAQSGDGALAERIIEAATAAIPAGLLASLSVAGTASRSPGTQSGRTGAPTANGSRGRAFGVRQGVSARHARLNLVETLRAAAPWQRLRADLDKGPLRVKVMRSDLRTTRYRDRKPTLTIFTVDASGSAALNRLAEAKGAVQLLLAQCYVRRDQVAVIGFRGRSHEILLPPTRSLVRAKRSLAGLPGGGGTPLATAIDASVALADKSRRRGESPTIVMLTDGRANIARDGSPGRQLAQADALRAAAAAAQSGIPIIFIDTSPRPNDGALRLSMVMRARYVPLPVSNASAVVRAVNSITTAARSTRS